MLEKFNFQSFITYNYKQVKTLNKKNNFKVLLCKRLNI